MKWKVINERKKERLRLLKESYIRMYMILILFFLLKPCRNKYFVADPVVSRICPIDLGAGKWFSVFEFVCVLSLVRYGGFLKGKTKVSTCVFFVGLQDKVVCSYRCIFRLNFVIWYSVKEIFKHVKFCDVCLTYVGS